MDITSMIGIFTPSSLIYFPQLQALDISACLNMDHSLFVDCINSCLNLNEFTMIGCNNFTVSQMVKMFTHLTKLQSVDCTQATPLMFCDAYTIISSLPALRIINFEPKNTDIELQDWKRLVAIFLNVQFGHSVMRIFPKYGQELRHDIADIYEQ